MRLPTALVVLLGVGACTGSAHRPPDTPPAEATTRTPASVAVAPSPQVLIPPHAMGVTRLALLSYPYWDGRESYVAAESAAARQQWPEVEARCRQTLYVNPDHARARRLLASALAMQEKPTEALEQLQMALADDWLQWAPGLAGDPTLAALRDGPERLRLQALLAGYGESFARSVARGQWLVGRRMPYAPPPTDRGQQPDSSRAEIVVYDPLEGRYHRITHTDENVLGFRRLRDGDVLFVTSRAAAPSGDHWQLAAVELRRLDGVTLAPEGAPIPGPSRLDRARVHEAPDGSVELVAWVGEGAAAHARYRLDWERGVLVPLDAGSPPAEPPPAAPGDLEVSHWMTSLAPEPPALRCSASHCTRPDGSPVELPPSQTLIASWTSPDGAWTAGWTADDSCRTDASALLLVSLRGPPERHLLHEGGSAFHRVRWVDATTLLFEVDPRSVRQFDVQSRQPTVLVANPSGLGLNGLGSQDGPCAPRLTPKLASIVGDWIRVLRNIEFETDSTELTPESYAILDDVATVLRQHPDISRLEIQGHTDRHASDEHNRQLSVARAEAVRDDLVKRCGIAPHRLIARGYGESKPLDRSVSEQADAKNRRVSFKIVERQAR